MQFQRSCLESPSLDGPSRGVVKDDISKIGRNANDDIRGS